ncbi:MAG: hydantoinase B/oxoprolinase family protein [Desulfobulbaceae bacterium]|nr:hydantoinase B/oxoprolinase family protein [Desulfobulbaceae bacterium]
MNVIEVEVFNKLFASVAEEMGIILTRSSFSSNIKERRDFSCALFDAKGDLVAQAAHIPVHLGAMPETLKYVLADHTFGPGDIVITNDPFKGGSHLPDITLIEAICDEDGSPLFYAANRAHHADVGGKTPGSMGLATKLADEGVLIPPTLLYSQKGVNKGFWDDFLSKVRNPEERKGDLRAQIAALARARVRVLELTEIHGKRHIADVLEELKSYTERLMRATISQIPDGPYRYCDYLDNDGISTSKIPLRVTLKIDKDEALVDFSESADQVPSPVNTVESVVISATVYAFQCIMGDGFPINQGSYRPITIVTRRGSILNAKPPAPVAAGNVETSQRIVDTLFGALAQALPLKIPAASCGSMNNVAIGGTKGHTDQHYTYYETIGGGMGARPTKAGLSAIHTHMTNTMNTPIEALEHSYPLQVEKYAVRYGSGGKGKKKGGDGIIRSYRFLSDGHISLLTERRTIAPYGLEGGGNGKKGENLLTRMGLTRKLTGKINIKAKKNDLLTIKTPGGGGWGKEQKK